MVNEEGLRSLFRGLTPGVHRQFLFTGIRLGLYDKVHQVILDDERNESSKNNNKSGKGKSGTTLGQEISLAILTSAIGITVANPSDVLKVRFQADNPNYSGSYLKITRTEGVVNGLYKGFTANLVRNSVISASEIVSYGTAKKTFIERLQCEDSVPVHLASGLCAGFVATLLGSPADVLGTKAMQKHGQYASQTAVQIAIGMAKNEGLLSFYKGFFPNFCRIGSFNILLWFFYEQIKSFALATTESE
jgi:solute carrier family 25 uncoupling protein 8/9